MLDVLSKIKRFWDHVVCDLASGYTCKENAIRRRLAWLLIRWNWAAISDEVCLNAVFHSFDSVSVRAVGLASSRDLAGWSKRVNDRFRSRPSLGVRYACMQALWKGDTPLCSDILIPFSSRLGSDTVVQGSVRDFVVNKGRAALEHLKVAISGCSSNAAELLFLIGTLAATLEQIEHQGAKDEPPQDLIATLEAKLSFSLQEKCLKQLVTILGKYGDVTAAISLLAPQLAGGITREMIYQVVYLINTASHRHGHEITFAALQKWVLDARISDNARALTLHAMTQSELALRTHDLSVELHRFSPDGNKLLMLIAGYQLRCHEPYASRVRQLINARYDLDSGAGPWVTFIKEKIQAEERCKSAA